MFYLSFKGGFALFVLFAASSVLCVPSDGEISSLEELFNSTQGPFSWSFSASYSWMFLSDPCRWYGVMCDEDESTVLGLDLKTAGLTGTLSSLSNLVNLTLL